MKKILLLTFLSFSIALAHAQTTYTWSVASGDLDAPGSWSPARASVAANDILVFDGSVQPTVTVTNIPSRELIGKLLITNNCAVIFSSSVGGVAGAGTIARTAAAVTGTGTSFSTTFVVGDIVNLIATANEVATVTSATAMTTVASGTVAAGSAYSMFSRISLSGGVNALSIASGSSLAINSTTPISLHVASGSTGSISGSVTFSGAAHRLNVADASGVTFTSGSAFAQTSTFSGSAFTATGLSNTVIFASGSTFTAGGGSNPFALSTPNSKVNFMAGSLFTQTSGTPSFSGRTYADFQLNSGTVVSVTGGSVTSVNNIIVSGNSTLNWGMTGTPGHAIKGNITVNSGSTFAFTGAGTTNLSGTALQTFSSTNAINIASGATVINNNTAGVSFTPNTFVTVAGTLNLNSNPLTLQSSSAGTASIGTVTGTLSNASNVTAERYIANKRGWRLITPSVYSTQTINAAWQEGAVGTSNNPKPGYGTFIVGSSAANGFDVVGSSGSLLAYNGTVFNSVPNTNATAVSLNTGYFLFSIGDRSVSTSTAGAHSATILRATGTAVSGTIPQATIAANGGFTLVGNPYPAAIDFSKILRSANVPDQFYAWDINLGTYGGYVLVSNSGGTYTSVPTSPSGLTNIIPQGGAVFLSSNNGSTGTIDADETIKATGTGMNTFANFSTSQAVVNAPHNLRVNLADASANLIDGVMTSYATGYSNAVDGGDAGKMTNFYENISIARSGKLLTLERRAEITATDTVHIQLSGVKTSSYKLQVDGAEFNQPGVTAYLNDAYLKTETKLDLTQINTVSFNANADTASYKNRFTIALAATAPVIAPIAKATHASANVVAYPNPAVQKQINLSFDGVPTGNYSITVMNAFGQVLQKNSMNYTSGSTAPTKQLTTDYSTGVYTVNIQSAGYNQSIKVVIP